MADIYDDICNYIDKNWIKPFEDSGRSIANSLDIDEKTLRRIKNYKSVNYKISIYTLHKICIAKDITLEEFFSLIRK